MSLDLNYKPNVFVETASLTEDEWLAWRRKGVGGSDVAAALGLSPYRTARELYYDKIGVVPAVEGEDKSITFEIGHLLEDVVAKIFAKKTGLSVYQDQKMFQHPLFPFMLADVDRFIHLPNGDTGILECKTAHYDTQYLWANGAVPRHYELQVKHYIFLYVTEDQTVPMEARRNSYQSSKKIHFSAIGHHLPETETVEVDLDGKWQQSSYGVQLSVEKCEQKLPTDNKGIVAYLSSGFIKGIGPETAKAIVARFGSRTLEVMENDPQQLLTIKGIKQGKLQKIIDSYEKTRKLGALTAFLAPYDVSEKKIMKIQEKFGDNSLNIVKTDPFQLCRIKGFGFLTVNAIAKKVKVSPKNPLRYAGAIEYTLEEARNSGHLFLPRDELIDRSHTLLNDGYGREVVSKAEILTAIQSEHQNGSIYVEHERVYLTFERTCEVKAAKRLVSLLLSEPIPKIRNLDDEIKKTEAKKTNLNLFAIRGFHLPHLFLHL